MKQKLRLGDEVLLCEVVALEMCLTFGSREKTSDQTAGQELLTKIVLKH